MKLITAAILSLIAGLLFFVASMFMLQFAMSNDSALGYVAALVNCIASLIFQLVSNRYFHMHTLSVKEPH